MALARAHETYVRICLAGSLRTPAKVLSKLAMDGNSDVRRWVASNPNADDEILNQLSKDSSDHVRDFHNQNPRLK